jgi:hypothetical protein
MPVQTTVKLLAYSSLYQKRPTDLFLLLALLIESGLETRRLVRERISILEKLLCCEDNGARKQKPAVVRIHSK